MEEEAEVGITGGCSCISYFCSWCANSKRRTGVDFVLVEMANERSIVNLVSNWLVHTLSVRVTDFPCVLSSVNDVFFRDCLEGAGKERFFLHNAGDNKRASMSHGGLEFDNHDTAHPPSITRSYTHSLTATTPQVFDSLTNR